ncbi:TetR/AcrR family transcriptional regulator [Mesorhizobium sp. IMUNJ 23232]|uniref:TetR/AcrR family transcriptional regulator n=1 Tax=Mesorhizobium sp. IMUNJ 23232 TaxID=3376064 RepID=UPI0037AD848F
MQKLGQTSKTDSGCARSRGRPRSFDREAALAQATRLFWSKGFEATSISDLTEAMGIGAPSLYAAFGSKEALYVEALHHYVASYERFSWARFEAAATVREAVESYLLDSAAALTGSFEDVPHGCMVTLASVCGEGHAELAELVRSERAAPFDRLKTRLSRAVAEGELPASVDIHALACFVQTVQSGMSILARDGTSCAELEAVAQTAMLGWDARTVGRDNAST